MKQERSTSHLRAVYEDDLDTLLDNLKITRDLEAGRLRCRACGVSITRDNLLALVPDSGAVTLICTNPACLKQYLRAEEA